MGKPAPESLMWISTKQEMMGWQWYQLDRMQIICTSLETDKRPCLHFITHFSTGWMHFLMPNQQCQSTVHVYKLCLLTNYMYI